MQGAKLIQQVKRKQKKMTGVLRKLMVVFGVFFVLLGIMISQAFMLAGFLLVALYFVFDVLSRKEYEYILDGKTLTIDVIYGKRYRKTAHIIDMTEMEVTAPNRHEAVAKYRKDGGGVRLPKFDYTSYEDDIPYYTMIVIEDREKKKLLLDLNQELLFALKKQYPSKVQTNHEQQMCAKSENPSFQRKIAGMQAVVMVDLLHHMARIMAI